MTIRISPETSDHIDRIRLIMHISEEMEARNYEAVLHTLADYAGSFGVDQYYYIQEIDCRLGLRDFDAAMASYQEAEKKGFAEEGLEAQKFRLLIYKKQYQEALELVDRIEKRNQQTGFAMSELDEEEIEPSSMIIKGSLKAISGSYDEAIQLLEDSLLEDYDEAAGVILGLCYILTGNQEKGLEFFYEALEADDELESIFGSIMPDPSAFSIHDRNQVVSQASRLLCGFIRFAFDVFEAENTLEDSVSETRRMIEQDPEEFLEVLQLFMNSHDTTPFFHLLESACYEALEDYESQKRSLRKVLTFPASEKQEENDTWLPLMIDSLIELDYSDQTNKKHLRRLAAVHGRSVFALTTLISAAEGLGYFSLSQSIIREAKPENFTEREIPEVLHMKAAVLELSDPEYLINELFRYRHVLRNDDRGKLAQLCLDYSEQEKVRTLYKEFMPDPLMAGMMLDDAFEWGRFSEVLKIYALMFSEETAARFENDQEYRYFCAAYGPASKMAADNLQNSIRDPDVLTDLNVLDFSNEPVDCEAYPFTISDNAGNRPNPFLIHGQEAYVHDESDYPILLKLNMNPKYQFGLSDDEGSPFMQDEQLYLNGGPEPLSPFTGYPEEFYTEDDEPDDDDFDEPILDDELIEYFDILDPPAELYEILPVIVTDPRFVDEIRKRKHLTEYEVDMVLGMILYTLAQLGNPFPQGHQDLEKIIFSDLYRNLYDAGRSILFDLTDYIIAVQLNRSKEDGEEESETRKAGVTFADLASLFSFMKEKAKNGEIVITQEELDALDLESLSAAVDPSIWDDGNEDENNDDENEEDEDEAQDYTGGLLN